MFEENWGSAKDYLKAGLKDLTLQQKKQLLLGDMPKNHKQSSSRLIQYVLHHNQLHPVFASKWVLNQLNDAIDLAETRRLYNHCALLHRVIEGWAFEELVLKNLDAGPRTLHLRADQKERTAATTEIWNATKVVSFSHKNFFQRGILQTADGTKIEVVHDVVLRPNKTNNESWDAVRIYRQGDVWRADFLELTLQTKHAATETVIQSSFQLLRTATQLPLSLQVRHVGVVDVQVFEQFSFAVLPARAALPREAKATASVITPAILEYCVGRFDGLLE